MPKPDFAALSTNLVIFNLLTPQGVFLNDLGYMDIRDVASVHVEALNPRSVEGHKRLIMSSPYENRWDAAIKFISETHPELKSRLITGTAPSFPFYKLPVNLQSVEAVTGVNSYRTWKETVLDAVASLLELEREWLKEGYEVKIPPLSDFGL